MKKRTSIVFITIGIFLLLLPFLSNMLLKYFSNVNMNELNLLTAENLEENQQMDAKFDFNSVQDVSLSRTLIGTKKFNKKCIIGQIIIPSIELNLPIVKGVSNENLLVGSGTMKNEQEMGEGNYTLAGHYNKREDTLFGGLMDIKIGSRIQITNKKIVYEYIVYQTSIVEDTDITILSDEISTQRGKPILSLMTCYYSSKTGKRLFVFGELSNQYPYDETFNTKLQKNIR